MMLAGRLYDRQRHGPHPPPAHTIGMKNEVIVQRSHRVNYTTPFQHRRPR
jgi:hypothetical protein